MLSTMQDRPLTINHIFDHGRQVYSGSEVVTFMGDGSRRATYGEVANRAERLAAGLRDFAAAGADEVILVVSPITERSIWTLGESLALLEE